MQCIEAELDGTAVCVITMPLYSFDMPLFKICLPKPELSYQILSLIEPASSYSYKDHYS
jgi:hypothetical protein